jgi:hypothetical protein
MLLIPTCVRDLPTGPDASANGVARVWRAPAFTSSRRTTSRGERLAVRPPRGAKLTARAFRSCRALAPSCQRALITVYAGHAHRTPRYTEMLPPFGQPRLDARTGHPQDGEDMYHCEIDDLWLIRPRGAGHERLPDENSRPSLPIYLTATPASGARRARRQRDAAHPARAPF